MSSLHANTHIPSQTEFPPQDSSFHAPSRRRCSTHWVHCWVLPVSRMVFSTCRGRRLQVTWV